MIPAVVEDIYWERSLIEFPALVVSKDEVLRAVACHRGSDERRSGGQCNGVGEGR